MNKNNKILLAISAILSAVFIFKKRDNIMTYVNEKVWDYSSQNKIDTLHPMVRNAAINFIISAEESGIKLRIVSAYRTYDEQNKLYAQGRTAKGNIVTNAKGGQSSHNFGTAIDVVPIVNGKPNWDADYTPIAKIGKALGFSWGGDWKSFKDKPHFEMNFGNSLAQLRDKHNSGQRKDGYVLLA